MVSGVGGCLTPLASGVQLVGIVGMNHAEEPTRLEVRVLDGESEVQTSEIELDAAEAGDGWIDLGQAGVECEWSDEPGAFVVEAREDGDWQQIDVTERADSECALVGIEVGGRFESLQFRVDSCEDVDPSADLTCAFAEE